MEEDKDSFANQKTEHQKIMIEAGVDLDSVVMLRRDIHKHAELGFKEVETQRKIREKLI
jgi:metal-dependent amidase/aminoacylase/carboxypeptidase family protein